MQALHRRPLFALVAAAALWGGAVTGTKYALRGFDPTTLLCVELTAATGALWVVLLVRGYRPPKSWRLPVLLGLLEPALAYLGDTSGLSRTTAVDGSILSGLEPALVVVLAAFLLGEIITCPVVLAVVLALGGLAVLAGAGHSHSASIGDLYVAGGILERQPLHHCGQTLRRRLRHAFAHDMAVLGGVGTVAADRRSEMVNG